VIPLAPAAKGDQNAHSLMGIFLTVLGVNNPDKSTTENWGETEGENRADPREETSEFRTGTLRNGNATTRVSAATDADRGKR
jgi:hypothetical protein